MSDNKDKKQDLHSDAWKRFERAVDIVAKSPPQHKTSKKNSKDKKPLAEETTKNNE
jgi:hypothetical protein